MADDTPLKQQQGPNADFRPIPDPTVLTTEALMREVSYLRTLLESQINHTTDITRLIHVADEKFEAERDRRLTEVKLESDRRLTEVATEREKALKIKEEADKEALRLDREIRQFKDEKASARTDSAVQALEQRLAPIDRFVALQQGGYASNESSRNRHGESSDRMIALIGIFIAVISAVSFIVYAVSIHH